MLPNPSQRMCTADLKVAVSARYARIRLKWPRPISILGIRADEPKRLKSALFDECKTIYPLADAGVAVEDVDAFWRAQPFDLQIRSEQGNCDLCFLKGPKKIVRLIREEPSLADWWIRQEEFRKESDRECAIRKSEDDTETEGISCFCGD